jgi:hypothetical protein
MRGHGPLAQPTEVSTLGVQFLSSRAFSRDVVPFVTPGPLLFLKTNTAVKIHFAEYTMNNNTLKRIEKPLAR